MKLNPFSRSPADLSDADLDRAAAHARAQLADILIKAARALAAVEKAEAAQDAARSSREGLGEAVEPRKSRLEGKALEAAGLLADALAPHGRAAKEAAEATRQYENFNRSLGAIDALRAFRLP